MALAEGDAVQRATEDEDSFVKWVREVTDDDVVAMVEFDADGYRFLYLDESPPLPEASYDAIHEELVVENLATGYHESLTDHWDRSRATIRVFDRATLFHFPLPTEDGGVEGFGMVVDRNTDTSIDKVLQLCEAWVDGVENTR